MRPLANPFMKFMLATMSLVVLAAPVRAQEIENPYAPKATERAKTQPNSVSYARMHDARGLNVFETPKVEGVPYDGFKMQWGAAFTQQFQSLKHENSQAPIPAADTLIKIGSGFNNAEANLYMDAQLARGMRVALTSYLSSRHHNETWVKDGYLLIDGSPWENETLDKVMEYVTLRLGHMEINYGDMHFRRTDNGSAMFNPLVGNLLMDAFTTEVGGEVYVRKGEYMGMVAVTGGEVRGQVIKPENRSPAVIAKVGYDKTFEPGTRFRITGSLYNTSKSNNNTLFSVRAREQGRDRDRAGVVGRRAPGHDPQGAGVGHQPVRHVQGPRTVRQLRAGQGSHHHRDRRSQGHAVGGRGCVPLPEQQPVRGGPLQSGQGSGAGRQWHAHRG
ncbi:MAG: hypothetical protein RL721_2401 [Candidatus Eisenbacteria bacterium]